MTFAPGQSGNPGGRSNEKHWREAVNRAVARMAKSGKSTILERIADRCVRMALKGDIQAIKEIGDRMDGKSPQATILMGDPENPLAFTGIERRIIDPRATNPDGTEIPAAVTAGPV